MTRSYPLLELATVTTGDRESGRCCPARWCSRWHSRRERTRTGRGSSDSGLSAQNAPHSSEVPPCGGSPGAGDGFFHLGGLSRRTGALRRWIPGALRRYGRPHGSSHQARARAHEFAVPRRSGLLARDLSSTGAGSMPTRSPSRASLGPASACLPAWAGSSTRRPLCRRPNASPGISTASSRLCSPSCGPPTSTRPTGALNTPSAPPSSIARSVAGIGRPAAHGPNRSSRVWSAPRVNAMSTSTTSSPRCCGRRGRWSPRLFASRRCRITRETEDSLVA